MNNMLRNKGSNMKIDVKSLNLNRLSAVNVKKLKQLENLNELLTTDTISNNLELKQNFETTYENKGILNVYEDENILQFNPRILQEVYYEQVFDKEVEVELRRCKALTMGEFLEDFISKA